MFCGKCGNDIGDLSVCPYCNPESQVQNDIEFQSPAQSYEPSPSYAPNEQTFVPDDDDSHTVLFSGLSEEQNPIAPPSSPPSYPPYGQSNPVGQNMGYQPPVAPSPITPSTPSPVTPSSYEPSEPPKKSKKGLIIGIVIAAVVLIAGGILAFILTAPMRNYSKAMDLKDNGKYEEAIDVLSEIEDYEDSADQIIDCKYLNAKEMIEEKKYAEARDIFNTLNGYQDSSDQIKKCDYLEAKTWLDAGKYDDAKAVFKKLGSYEDCSDLVQKCDYEKANELLKNKKYTDAKKIYVSLGNYSDSKTKLNECNYNIAKGMIDSKPSDAIDLLEDLGDYSDSKDLLKQAKMSYCKKNKDFTNSTTYKYLKELKEEKYKGASALYDELYTLKVTNVYWTDDYDSTTPHVERIAEGKTATLHFELSGYTPDQYSFDVNCEASTTDGGTASWDASGYNLRRTYKWGLNNATKGTLTVKIYIDDKLAHTVSVQIV